MECSLCGISGENIRLFDVISGREGIIKVCKNCAFKENMPIIKNSDSSKFEEPEERKQSVRERLSVISGVDVSKSREEKNEELKRQEENLKEIVNNNVEQNFREPGEDSNLIRNFHWIIMRKRRKRHMTQSQFAKAIYEPELTVRKIEKGEVPRERERLISKIEKYLGVRITKQNFSPPENLKGYEGEKAEEDNENVFQEPEIEEGIEGFDSINSKDVTIGELRRIKEKIGKKFFSKKKSTDSEEESEVNSEDNQ